jgi:hypothetical protein
MDKSVQDRRYLRGQRGFALMITLSVLSVVIALTVVLLSYFNEVKQDADETKALLQANIYYVDLLEQFKKVKDPKSIFSRLYVRPVSLRSDDGRFSLNLSCSPLNAGININWLILDKAPKKGHLFGVVEELFEFIEDLYRLEDTQRLLEMIEEEIRGEGEFERSERRLIQKDGIISFLQFKEIIKRYEIEVDDQKVSQVPWQEYLSFSQKSEKIDVEYSSARLISFLFDIDLRSVEEWKYAINKPSLVNFVNMQGGDYASRKSLIVSDKASNESHCMVTFDGGYRFSFDYIAGEARYFEFHEK